MAYSLAEINFIQPVPSPEGTMVTSLFASPDVSLVRDGDTVVATSKVRGSVTIYEYNWGVVSRSRRASEPKAGK